MSLDPSTSSRRTKLVLVGILAGLLILGYITEPLFADLFKAVVLSQ